MALLSYNATQIMTSRIGYRNTELFDGSDYTAEEAFKYETSELGNSDIIDFIKEHYDINITSSKSFLKWLHSIKQFSKKSELFLYWFTSRQDVFALYNRSNKAEPIQQFILPQDSLLVSDLDIDGIAIVSASPLSSLYQTTI